MKKALNCSVGDKMSIVKNMLLEADDEKVEVMANEEFEVVGIVEYGINLELIRNRKVKVRILNSSLLEYFTHIVS